MARPSDTIAALATPTGTSAIALLRVSGPAAGQLARDIAGSALTPRTVVRGDYRDRSRILVDDVLHSFFPAPNSYTGEDLWEVSCHGSPYIAQRILDDLIARGCRAAEPGEFTQRAFLNGRIDLSQAEAVMDLIHARSEGALTAANRQLRGALGRTMHGLIDGLLQAIARLEAYIDFPEEDLPAEDRASVLAALDALALQTSQLLATTRYGTMLREGIRAVLLGAPNAGKSSILNRLVGEDRALVSAEPGTTRDYLEEPILVGPHLVRLVDTAGLNAKPGRLEALGMKKSLEQAAQADVFLCVLDASEEAPALPAPVADQFAITNTLVLLNKVDLRPADASPLPSSLGGLPTIQLSALTGVGFPELTERLVRQIDQFCPSGSDGIAINARHAEALALARGGLESARSKLVSSDPIELVASDLRSVLAAYGAIAGRVDNERMLDALFARFCIGK